MKAIEQNQYRIGYGNGILTFGCIQIFTMIMVWMMMLFLKNNGIRLFW